MAQGNFPVFSAFVVERQEPLVSFTNQVLAPQARHGANPGTRVGQDGDRRPIPQPPTVEPSMAPKSRWACLTVISGVLPSATW